MICAALRCGHTGGGRVALFHSAFQTEHSAEFCSQLVIILPSVLLYSYFIQLDEKQHLLLTGPKNYDSDARLDP